MTEFYRLTPKSNSDLRNLLSIQTKRLGVILQEAGLVSPYQIELALEDKIQYPDLLIGDILAKRGIIKPETADFFVQDWSNVVRQEEKDALGYYLKQAALLDNNQIEVILAEQRETGIRFGTVAVFQGFLKSTTLDFFLTYLFPEELNTSPFINMYSKK
jgi:hypothetical protein